MSVKVGLVAAEERVLALLVVKEEVLVTARVADLVEDVRIRGLEMHGEGAGDD